MIEEISLICSFFLIEYFLKCLSKAPASSFLSTSIQYSISGLPSSCPASLGLTTIASNSTFPLTFRNPVYIAARSGFSVSKIRMSYVVRFCKNDVASGPRIEITDLLLNSEIIVPTLRSPNSGSISVGLGDNSGSIVFYHENYLTFCTCMLLYRELYFYVRKCFRD